MPWNLGAEKAVLGCILIDETCLSQVSVFLKPEAFYNPQHKAIYTVMLSLDTAGTGIDPLVVLDALVKENVFDSDAGKKYLTDLASSVPSTENVEKYAKIVREAYYLRALIGFSEQTIDSALSQENTADEILDAAEQNIYNIREGKTTDAPSPISDILINDVFEDLRNRTGEDAELYKGYSTGFTELDNILSGLNRSDLIIIGARPAMGKTSFALNLARNISLIGKRKTLFFSLEMTKGQVGARVLATEARVSSNKMRNGQISVDEWKRLGDASKVLSSCPLYFDDSSAITVPAMKAKARRLKGVECVIIDYLGLIRPTTKAENKVNEIAEITRNLKMMAKDLNIPVICCAQLSRVTEARGKSHKPQLSDLRDSGSIEQDADIVMMLYREDYYKGDGNGEAGPAPADEVNKVSVIVAKNRHGGIGEVEFAWDAEHTLFLPIEKVHNEG